MPGLLSAKNVKIEQLKTVILLTAIFAAGIVVNGQQTNDDRMRLNPTGRQWKPGSEFQRRLSGADRLANPGGSRGRVNLSPSVFVTVFLSVLLVPFDKSYVLFLNIG